MIKINLATALKKRAIAAQKTGTRTIFTSISDSFTRMNAEGLSAFPLRKLMIHSVVAATFYWFLGTYKEEEVKKWDMLISQQRTEITTLQAEIKKYSNVEEKQKSLKADEASIRSRMEAIQTLSENRGVPPKLLTALASGIPKEIWLESFSLSAEDYKLKGHSYTLSGTGYDQVTDFMSTLEQSAYLKDVRLLSTEKKQDETSTEIAAFELSAKKRQ